jgi:hypothetical protein
VPSSLTPRALAGLLADPARMQVLAAVALGASVAELPERTGLSPRQAAAALHRLQTAGLLAPGPEVAYDRLRELAADPDPDPDPAGLQPFVHGRQLRSLPAQSSRRRRVLEHVAAQTFRPDESYDEPAVNELLAPWCEGGEVDHAALRRYLVEEGLMSRGQGVYRLGAGTAEPGPAERRVQAMGLT